MEKYKNAHKWLIIPFVIAILGFMRSYYLKLSEASWGHHIHAMSATFWYLMVIIQPYLATHGNIKKHKRYGVLAMVLAGAVVASALLMIPGNIESAAREDLPPMVPPSFFYGVSLLDMLTIAGFVVSVIMSIIKVKNIDDHAMWMISTVFWAIMPAFARLALIPAFMIGGEFTSAFVIAVINPIVFIVIGIVVYKIKRFHPALVVVAIAHILFFFVKQIGENELWISIATAVFKP
ncbi:MAG: hypothetical protein ABFS32_06445 [Bacteroidota bacterium]